MAKPAARVCHIRSFRSTNCRQPGLLRVFLQKSGKELSSICVHLGEFVLASESMHNNYSTGEFPQVELDQISFPGCHEPPFWFFEVGYLHRLKKKAMNQSSKWAVGKIIQVRYQVYTCTILFAPQGSKCLLRRYLVPKTIHQIPPQKVLGAKYERIA